MMNNRKALVSFLIILVGLTVIIFVIKNLPTREESHRKRDYPKIYRNKWIGIKTRIGRIHNFYEKDRMGGSSRIVSDWIRLYQKPIGIRMCECSTHGKYSGYEDRYGGYEVDEDLKEAVIPTSVE